jgi:hypothetical protein
MAAPTNCNVKKVLANPEPSTHGTFAKWRPTPSTSGNRVDRK